MASCAHLPINPGSACGRVIGSKNREADGRSDQSETYRNVQTALHLFDDSCDTAESTIDPPRAAPAARKGADMM
jgi:hypothetical protein